MELKAVARNWSKKSGREWCC